VAIVNYGDLLLSGSGNKTFAGVTTIAGDLVISDGQLLLFNNTGSSTGTLTLGKSSNNFGFIWREFNRYSYKWNLVTTTGTINVSSSCIAGTWLGLADGLEQCCQLV
jgi:hypothetical protein